MQFRLLQLPDFSRMSRRWVAFVCTLTIVLLLSSCPTPLDTTDDTTDDTSDTDTACPTCPTCPTCPDDGDDDADDDDPPVEPPAVDTRIQSYAIYYGAIDATVVNSLKVYDLVIIHPDQAMNSSIGLTTSTLAAYVSELQAAGVKVIAYVSVGEDLRVRSCFHSYDPVEYPELPATGLHPDWDELMGDARFYRSTDYNYIGPGHDPRGALDGGGPLDGYYRWPSMTHSGWAPFYLDDGSINWSDTAMQNYPDYNQNFGAFFVNVGDRLWYETLRDQTRVADGLFGMEELLSSAGLGVDGLFLDTIDTMGPNTYTDEGMPVPSEFEWTAPGLLYFIQNLKHDYPGTLVVQNRGLFFFDPRLAHYRHSARSLVDFVMFESYRLDSSTTTTTTFTDDTTSYYRENQKRIRQALMVEASRPDGFQVLSLGYVASASDEAEVAADIEEANASGFVHFITNPNITDLRTDALHARDTSDTAMPVWSSTGYVNFDDWPYAYSDNLEPRAGWGSFEWGYKEGYDSSDFRLYYDIALDRTPVTYIVYRFNLINGTILNPDIALPSWEDPWTVNGPEWQEFFAGALRIVLETRVRPEYEDQYVTAPPVYATMNEPPLPYWSAVPDTQTGTPYLFLLRAVDASGNETGNTNLLKLTL